MADEPRTGAFSYCQYGLEANFGAESAAITSAFGHNVSCVAERRNNLIRRLGLNDRNVQKLINGNFEGIVTIEGDLASTHWLAALWGASASTSSAPYVHTYTEANTLPSITIEDGTDLGTTDSISKYLGCKLDDVGLTMTVGEVIRFRALFFYRTELEGTSIDASPATDAEEPFTFANATIEIPDGTTLNRVQRLEWGLRNALTRRVGLGSRLPSKIIPTTRSYEFSFDKSFENSAMLEQSLGTGTGVGATQSETSADINITNGGAAAAERHLQIQMGGVKFDNFQAPKIPGEVIDESITAIARTGTGIGEDNTATTIFD